MHDSNFYISNSDNREVSGPLLLKKLWMLAVCIIVILLGLDYLFINHIVYVNEFSNQGKVKRLIESDNPNEVPVFGASLARSSFIPDSISPDCYNYGMGKALYDVTRILFKIECEKDKSAPIIFEFNQRTFIRNPHSSINASTFIPHLDNEMIEDFMKESGLLSWHYNVPGLRFYGNYLEYGVGPFKRSTGEKKDNRGVMLESKTQTDEDVDIFARRLNNMTAKRAELLEQKADSTRFFSFMDEIMLAQLNDGIYFSYDKEYLREFETLVSNNRQRKFILVTVPMNENFYRELPNIEEFISFATELADRHENVYYLNYARELDLDSDYFKDPMHFSTKGARIFSSVFQKDFERITGIDQNGRKTLP